MSSPESSPHSQAPDKAIVETVEHLTGVGGVARGAELAVTGPAEVVEGLAGDLILGFTLDAGGVKSGGGGGGSSKPSGHHG